MSQVSIGHRGPEPDYRGGAMVQTEYELVEFDCVASGRAVVANAVMRAPGGEAWMRQIATLPLYIEPEAAPRPARNPNWPLEALALVVITLAWLWFLAWAGSHVWRIL